MPSEHVSDGILFDEDVSGRRFARMLSFGGISARFYPILLL